MQQTAKISNEGSHQSIQLPEDFHFEGEEVSIRKDIHTGEVILSPPKQESSLDEFFRMVAELTQEERDAFQIPGRDRTPLRAIDLAE